MTKTKAQVSVASRLYEAGMTFDEAAVELCRQIESRIVDDNPETDQMIDDLARTRDAARLAKKLAQQLIGV